MDWSDIKAAVGDAAPILGTLLGGPAGAAVGGLIATALGTKAEPGSVEAALRADPAAAAKLVELQTNAQVQLQQLAVQAEGARLAAQTAAIQAAYADTAGARAMQIATRSWVPPAIGIFVVAAWAGLSAVLMFYGTPGADGVVLGRVLGTVDGALMLVLGYYFGSSRGERAAALQQASVLSAQLPVIHPPAL